MLALTIGNFDGVHRGHQALVAAARRLAGPAEEGGRVVAVTFEPHPAARLRPDAVPPRLALPAERQRLLRKAGASEVLELDPTPALLDLEPARFLDELRARVPFTAIVEGGDFRFGRGRSGSIATLRELGAARGFAIEVLPPVDVTLTDHTVVRASSSIVRWLLTMGRVRDAALVLGRPYELTATTVPGDRRGRTIGFPTLNAAPSEQLLPMDGVYGGVAHLPDGRRALAAISVGTKPTFGASARTCEAHLLDIDLPLDWYGAQVRMSFVTWIREQRAFGSLDALLERIRSDIRAIRERLGGRPVGEPLAAAGGS